MSSAERRYLRLAWAAARALEWREALHWLWLYREARRRSWDDDDSDPPAVTCWPVEEVRA